MKAILAGLILATATVQAAEYVDPSTAASNGWSFAYPGDFARNPDGSLVTTPCSACTYADGRAPVVVEAIGTQPRTPKSNDD